MRILRRKSSREVSSSGFALFVIGLVSATFIGGAVRTLLKSDRIHQQIVSELRNRLPQHEIHVGRTEVLLSHGMWPGFGLKVIGLEIKQEVCGKLSFALNVPEAVLPVDLLSVRGNLRLGQVEVNNGRIHLNYRDCATRMEPGLESSASVSESPASSGVRGGAPAIKPLHLEWQTLAEHLDGVHLNEFAVTYERNVTWKLAIHEADIRFGKELQYSAHLDVQKSLPFGGLVHAVDVEGRGVDRVLSWDVSSEFKEGRLLWSGSWDLSSNMARTSLNLHQLPVKDFLSELFQMGFLRQEIGLKATWLTADFEWEGKVANYREFPVRIKEFTFVGGYGRVELADPVEMKLTGERSFRIPALLKVSQLQIQPIIDALKVTVLPTVLSRLGVWSGTIVYTSWRDWKLDGFLENLEVAFSNQSVRGKQSVRRMHTVVSRGGARFEGLVDEAVLHEGDFLGLVNLTWNEDAASGEVKVRLERLSLSPSVQNLLIGGEATPIKFQGEGRLTASGLEDWTAAAEIARINGRGWNAEALEVKGKSLGPNVRMDLNVAQLTLESAWRYGSHLKELGEERARGVRWRHGSGQILLTKGGGEALGVTAAEISGAQWRGRGSWVRDGDFKAAVSLITGNISRRFSIHGNAGELHVEPETGSAR